MENNYKNRTIGGQDIDLIFSKLEELLEYQGKASSFYIKDSLVKSFFLMIMNHEGLDEDIRLMAEIYMLLYDFFSNFDEQYIEQGLHKKEDKSQ